MRSFRFANFVTLLTVFLLLTSGLPAAQAASYPNCSVLSRSYPLGVAKSAATARVAVSDGFKRPTVSLRIYSANRRLDPYRDGYICTKLQSPGIAATPTSTPTPTTTPNVETQKLIIALGKMDGAGWARQFANSSYTQAQYCDSGGVIFTDINSNTPVVVKDGTGQVLASARLGSAFVAPATAPSIFDSCAWRIELSVPKSVFYEISIGSRFYTTRKFLMDELIKLNWKATLILSKPLLTQDVYIMWNDMTTPLKVAPYIP